MYNGPQELIYINGSRRKVLVALIMEIRSEVCVLTMQLKGLGQRFEERGRGQPAQMSST